jgi:hypothetical protein
MIAIIKSQDTRERVYNIFVFLLFIIFWTFFLKFLWNQTLVPHITILKPTISLVDTFLLSVGLAVFKF